MHRAPLPSKESPQAFVECLRVFRLAHALFRSAAHRSLFLVIQELV